MADLDLIGDEAKEKKTNFISPEGFITQLHSVWSKTFEANIPQSVLNDCRGLLREIIIQYNLLYIF